jgi:hypothetical protein
LKDAFLCTAPPITIAVQTAFTTNFAHNYQSVTNTVRHTYWIDKIISRCSSVIGRSSKFLIQVNQ